MKKFFAFTKSVWPLILAYAVVIAASLAIAFGPTPAHAADVGTCVAIEHNAGVVYDKFVAAKEGDDLSPMASAIIESTLPEVQKFTLLKLTEALVNSYPNTPPRDVAVEKAAQFCRAVLSRVDRSPRSVGKDA